MIPRLASALAALALAICLAGCAPDTAPAPTPTGFASEEEAFAAAEETYRAYVDALNRVDLSDPATFEDVYAWTTGDSNSNERKSLTQMHADGWRVAGQTRTLGFHGATALGSDTQLVVAVVCSDVSSISLIDADGVSVVDEDRRDHYALEVTFSGTTQTRTGLAIASSNAIEAESCSPPL